MQQLNCFRSAGLNSATFILLFLKIRLAGYYELINNLEKDLCEITGFKAVSFQPNSGASGEYTGLMVIREYQKSKNESNRNICLIPASAHGTNPASSVMAGMTVVVVKCDDKGNIDMADLEEKASKIKTTLLLLWLPILLLTVFMKKAY